MVINGEELVMTNAAGEIKEMPRLEPMKLKLDIGCGPNKLPGFVGMDIIEFDGVDIVCDVPRKTWPLNDDSVDEVHCSHFLEHLTNLNDKWERVKFFNELHRVLKKDAVANITIPHWASERYYGDPTHKEPMSEMAFAYLNREWRLREAPHCDTKFAIGGAGYSCDFDHRIDPLIHPALIPRAKEFLDHALEFYKNAVLDIRVVLIAKK